VRIKILAGSQSSHQREFRFPGDFDRVICRQSGAMTMEQVIRHNHNGGCPGGGVRVVPGGLPGEDERIKKR
jgi:hypothetical protein